MKVLNTSVEKSFKVLEKFTSKKPSWGVRELALALNSNQSSIYRIMATLRYLGVLHKDDKTNRYSLGLKLFELGSRVDSINSFVKITHPILEEVSNKIQETVHLGILRHFKVLCLDKVESPKGLKLNSQVGSFSPCHCTGLGKVLLAALDKAELQNYMNSSNLKSFTSNTITSQENLIEKLKIIKNNGYALDLEELEYGLICLAVPIMNEKGKILASLSAAGPANRFKREMMPLYLEILNNGAKEIGKQLGHLQLI